MNELSEAQASVLRYAVFGVRNTEKGGRNTPCPTGRGKETMDGIITILCALLGSGAATALVTALVNRRAEERRTETGESQGLRWLLQDRLEQQALAYLRRGSVTYDELRNWNRGHRIYHDLLGGNGDLNGLREELKRLLYETEEETKHD